MLQVHLRCFSLVMHRVMVMGVSQVRMMSGFLVGTRRVMRRGLPVMVCRMRMMLSCFAMMVYGFFRHVHPPSAAGSASRRSVLSASDDLVTMV
jgi:hypothetical protein